MVVKGEDGTYTCANLALEGGYAFRTPYAFTATSASVKKTMPASGFATFVSPFEVSVADGCKAFNLTGVDNNDMVVGEETATLAANAPALLSGNGEYGFTATGVEVTATPQSLVNGILTASYADGAMAPKGSYVLQTQAEGTAFYKVQEDGKQRVTPFTAYLSLPEAAGVNVRSIGIGFSEDGTTGISAVADGMVGTAAVYDLQGRKMESLAKGINVVKYSDGSVKKVIIK